MSVWPTTPDFEKPLLTWLLATLEGDSNGEEDRTITEMSSYPLIARLYAVLELMTYPVGEITNFSRTPIAPAVREVVKGLLAILDIRSENLASELRLAIASFERDEHPPFLDLADDIEPPVDWSRVPKVSLDSNLLVEGLRNRRRAIVRAAALLLAHAAWSSERVPDLAALLDSPSRSTVRAAGWVLITAAPVSDALDVLLVRLAGESTGGCGDLYDALAPLYARSDEPTRVKIVDRLFEGLLDTHSYAAGGAAQAIRSLHLASDPSRDAQLQSAFEHWKHAEIRCHDCNRVTTKKHCEKCGYVLNTPLAPILRELGARGVAPPLSEIAQFFASEWRDLGKAAKAVAREMLAAQPHLLRLTVDGIANADASLSPLLPIILGLDARTVEPVKAVLLKGALRGEHLPQFLDAIEAPWLSRTEAESIVRLARDAGPIAQKAIAAARKLREQGS